MLSLIQQTLNEAHLSAYGLPLIYDGEDMVLSEGEGAWVPVVPAAYRRRAESERCGVQCVFPCTGTPLEAMPGIGILPITRTEWFW